MRTLITNAQVFNTWLKKFIPGWILIDEGRIRYAFVDKDFSGCADEVIDAEGCYCIPSLIDIHLHIESSMVTPPVFSKAILKHGVTTCVAEPHEISNVFGMEGMKAFMRSAKDCEADIFWGIASSVPCSPFETTGGRIELADALELLKEDDRVACLGEVMNCYSVLHEPDGKIRRWLECLRRGYPGLTREGHIAYYKGEELCDIAYYGVDSDHTSTGLEYFIERLKMGIFGELQDKTITQEIVDYVEENDIWDHYSLVTDDVMPDLLQNRGHLDYLVKKAIRMGMRPERAITAATWNPAQRMKFYDRGMIAPGYIGDLILIGDLKEFDIRRVLKNGKTVFVCGEDEAPAETKKEFPGHFYSSVRLPELTADDFTIKTSLPDGVHEARTMVPRLGISMIEEGRALLEVKNGTAKLPDECCYIAVFDRYTGKAGRMLGLTGGNDFLKNGAVACSYAHDHHNLLVAGKTAEDCAAAANWVIEHQGGYCVVEDGKVIAGLVLEVGGIVSEHPLKEIAENAAAITAALKKIGYLFDNPIMTFSVLGLSVSPRLRITDKGYVDTKGGKLLPLFVEEDGIAG